MMNESLTISVRSTQVKTMARL